MKPGILLVSTIIALAAGPASAAESIHDHGHAGGSAATLQLDAGRKWPTDAALRTSMDTIRRSLAAALPAIHEGRLPAKDYGILAQTIDDAVGQIVAQCKLGPAADAQLHIVVARLLAGAEQMRGERPDHRTEGAVGTVRALEDYGAYFDDPGFRPLSH